MKYKNAAQYISLNDAFKGDLVIGYADDRCLSKATLPMERGVGRIYSQCRGRGHKEFFWGPRPQTPSDSLLLLGPPVQNVLRGPWSEVDKIIVGG